MYFQYYQDTQGYWRWRLKGANHEILASGEAYVTKAGCLHVIELLKSTTSQTPVYQA